MEVFVIAKKKIDNEIFKTLIQDYNIKDTNDIKDILIMSVDNLKGFSEAISSVFPKTEIQKCVVHQIRNSIDIYLTKIQGNLHQT